MSSNHIHSRNLSKAVVSTGVQFSNFWLACSLLLSELRSVLFQIETIGLTATACTEDMMLQDMLADGAKVALERASVAAAATPDVPVDPSAPPGQQVPVAALRAALQVSIAQMEFKPSAAVDRKTKAGR